MIDISKINDDYTVRMLTESDAESVLKLCEKNTLFNHYCRIEPTLEVILDDMLSAPNGSDLANKYFMGFYKDKQLVAIMDYIDEWPEPDSGFLKFFMVDVNHQGRNIGSDIIQRFFSYLGSIGRTKVISVEVADNPQAKHFYEKNGCSCVDTIESDWLTAVITEKNL